MLYNVSHVHIYVVLHVLERKCLRIVCEEFFEKEMISRVKGIE